MMFWIFVLTSKTLQFWVLAAGIPSYAAWWPGEEGHAGERQCQVGSHISPTVNLSCCSHVPGKGTWSCSPGAAAHARPRVAGAGDVREVRPSAQTQGMRAGVAATALFLLYFCTRYRERCHLSNEKHTPRFLPSLLTQLGVPDLLRE